MSDLDHVAAAKKAAKLLTEAVVRIETLETEKRELEEAVEELENLLSEIQELADIDNA